MQHARLSPCSFQRSKHPNRQTRFPDACTIVTLDFQSATLLRYAVFLHHILICIQARPYIRDDIREFWAYA